MLIAVADVSSDLSRLVWSCHLGLFIRWCGRKGEEYSFIQSFIHYHKSG